MHYLGKGDKKCPIMRFLPNMACIVPEKSSYTYKITNDKWFQVLSD